MNDLARQKLIDAAMRGVRQIRGQFRDGKGGLCALGVLGFLSDIFANQALSRTYDFSRDLQKCPFGCAELLSNEGSLIVHLNDDHDLDFLTIARKL